MVPRAHYVCVSLESSSAMPLDDFRAALNHIGSKFSIVTKDKQYSCVCVVAPNECFSRCRTRIRPGIMRAEAVWNQAKSSQSASLHVFACSSPPPTPPPSGTYMHAPGARYAVVIDFSQLMLLLLHVHCTRTRHRR